MPDQIRVGIISTSWWADMMHLPSMKSHPRVDVAAICGRHRHRAEEMARKYDIPQVFSDYREMIARADLHAVIIATPDDLHYPMTITALDAGLHVLYEKPLALNARQAKEMAQRADQAGLKHMIHYTWRWMPYFQYLRLLIDEGYLGKCFHAHFNWFADYGREAKYQWKWDRRRSLGTLGDLGSHMIDLARWTIGDITRVNAHLATHVPRAGIDDQPLDQVNDSAILNLEFENGAQGVIHVSTVAHLADRWHEKKVILHGESGTIEVEVHFGGGYNLRGARQNDDRIGTLPIPEHFLRGVDPTSPFVEQITQVFTQHPAGGRLFIDAIVEDRPAVPNFYNGLAVQEVIDAAFKSDQGKCWVALK